MRPRWASVALSSGQPLRASRALAPGCARVALGAGIAFNPRSPGRAAYALCARVALFSFVALRPNGSGIAFRASWSSRALCPSVAFRPLRANRASCASRTRIAFIAFFGHWARLKGSNTGIQHQVSHGGWQRRVSH